MDHDENPYASPKADASDPDRIESEAQRVRHQYIGHESAVRSIAFLFYLASLVCTAALLFLPFDLFRSGPSYRVVDLALFLMLIGVAIGTFWLGHGIARLKQKVLLPVGILSTVGLLGVPFGTLISALVLYLVFGKKGRFVFSEEYLDIVQQTPHVRCRTPLIAWLVFAALSVAIAVGIFFLG